MTALPKMTEDEALAFYDFTMARFMGWEVSLASNNPRGRRDFRATASRQASDLHQDIILNSPRAVRFWAAVSAGQDIVLLWPEELQEVVRFQIDHTCPRSINEPLTKEKRKFRRETQGLGDWPAFLDELAKPATCADHPPFPPHSALLRHLMANNGSEA